MGNKEDFVFDIPKGSKGDVIRVSVSDYEGTRLVGIRIWYQGDTGELRPTQKGISLSTEYYDDIMEALTGAKEHI